MMREETRNMEIVALKAMFETGKIKKMGEIGTLIPTKIAKLLGINYGRYINKLFNPELFSIKEIINLSNIIDIDFEVILALISKELKSRDTK